MLSFPRHFYQLHDCTRIETWHSFCSACRGGSTLVYPRIRLPDQRPARTPHCKYCVHSPHTLINSDLHYLHVASLMSVFLGLSCCVTISDCLCSRHASLASSACLIPPGHTSRPRVALFSSVYIQPRTPVDSARVRREGCAYVCHVCHVLVAKRQWGMLLRSGPLPRVGDGSVIIAMATVSLQSVLSCSLVMVFCVAHVRLACSFCGCLGERCGERL